MKNHIRIFLENNLFGELIKDATIFYSVNNDEYKEYLKPESRDKEKITKYDLTDDYISTKSDLPFSKCIWINAVTHDGNTGLAVYYIEELSPEKFKTSGYMLIDNKPYFFGGADKLEFLVDDVGLAGLIFCLYLEKARREKGLGKVSASVGVSRGVKRKKEDVTFYYLGTNKNKKTLRCSDGTKIEYSNSFIVSGHWRVHTSSKGKDRDGNRNVDGFTWVSSFVKGDGYLKQSIRVIK